MFTPSAMIIVWTIPSIIAACLLLGASVHFVTGHRYKRPIWLRNIISRAPDPLKPVDLTKPRPWIASPPLQLLAIAILGCTMQVVKYGVFYIDEGHNYDDLPTQHLLLLTGWVRLISLW